jgi:hypothetical protein
VIGVLAEDEPQVPFPSDQHPVQAFAAGAADPAFGDRVRARQAFAALTGSPGARTHYDQQRRRGATHHQALRTLSNRLVGILDGCLRHRTPYNEAIAWAHHTADAA